MTSDGRDRTAAQGNSQLSMRLGRFFLGVASVTCLSTIVCGLGWYIAARPREISIDELGLEDRQKLVESFFDVSSKARTPTWYEPSLAFTLRRGSKISAWGDTFTSNDLGFRAGPSRKDADVFRIVFAGDSWAYGMGLSAQESFPKQFEALANSISGSTKKIEAWNLALPGYNTINELAAIEVFFDRIKPDAVILCPTRNDNSSELYVLPDGSVRRPTGVYRDTFGDDHSLDYRYRFLDSHRYMERWTKAFDGVASMEAWLEDRGVPFFLVFVAYWEDAFVHHLISESGIKSPYIITPKELATPDKQPPPWYHATAETYEIYAQMVYQGVSTRFGWADFATPTDHDQTGIFKHLPSGSHAAAARQSLRQWCARVPTSYQATPEADTRQCAGPMDCGSGLMGRATTILLRRLPNTSSVEVSVRKVPDLQGLYPLELEVSIPGSTGAAVAAIQVPAGLAEDLRVSVEIPDSIDVGSVMEIEVRASAALLAPDVSSLRSIFIDRIEQR